MIDIPEPTPTQPPSTALLFQIDTGPFDPFTLWMRSETACLTASPEAYVAATLLPAMTVGASSITPPGPLDPMFADNLRTIQDIFTTWYPDLGRVDVQSKHSTKAASPSSCKTATFFTGGVDSFYTLLKHEQDIDILIYVHGLDVTLDNTPLRKQVSDMLHEVGAHFGKEVIEVETNLRDFSDRHSRWERYHGAALATIALTLQRGLDRIFIPSSRSYSNLKPWGSSPLLDPLWSTEQLKIIHDGCEADRLAKCRGIAHSAFALSHLRVCWENRNNAYNCGRCEKCLRTMVQLLAAGGLDRCTTFKQPLDPALMRKLPTIREKAYRYRPARDALDEKDMAPHVVQAIDAALQGPSLFQRAYQRAYKRARWVYHRVYDTLGA